MSTHGKRAVRQRLRAATTAAAAMALLAAPLCITTSASAAEAHVDNPFAGATQYVNPTYAAAVESAATRAGDATLAAKMRTVAKQPTAVWMDRISAITGNADGNGLKFHLDNAVAQKGSGPIVFNLVIYDLPGRDCFALASNGELPATDAGLARYKTEYIDAIAALLADPKYAGPPDRRDDRARLAAEPDDEHLSEAACAQAAPYYKAGVKYALDKLHAIPNVYNYIDIGHSGWLGWDSNAGPSATLFADVARPRPPASRRSTASSATWPTRRRSSSRTCRTPRSRSVARRSGRARSTSGTSTSTRSTSRRTCTACSSRPGSRRRSACSSTPRATAGAAPHRPTATSTSTNHNTYVNESKVDKRVHRGAWCNPLGAGIGELPQATPSGYTGLAPRRVRLDQAPG